MKKLITLCIALLITSAAYSQATKEAVHIYDPKANAEADINAAVAKAKKENKHVFVQVGGNWCIWCIRFHALVDSVPALKTYLNTNYETVMLNWSPENKNEAILKKYNYPGRFGFPVFLILDGNGKLLHTQNSSYLEEGKGHSAKKVIEFLKSWNYGACCQKTISTSVTRRAYRHAPSLFIKTSFPLVLYSKFNVWRFGSSNG
jgi:thioredoxin-related protein